MRAIAAAALVALCVRPAAGQAQEQEEYVPDLGVHTISDAEHMVTLPAASREHLNRALVWQYGFNQPEAQKEARQAIDSASGVCALCHTVKAYTLGPFLNKPMMSQAEASLAHEETQQSLELLDAAPGSPSAKERGVIEAFALRHASADAASLTTEGHVAATQAFYGAMCELASTLDDDADMKDFNLSALEEERLEDVNREFQRMSSTPFDMPMATASPSFGKAGVNAEYSSSSSSDTSLDSDEDVEVVEQLLESYFMRLDNTWNRYVASMFSLSLSLSLQSFLTLVYPTGCKRFPSTSTTRKISSTSSLIRIATSSSGWTSS